MTLKFKDYNLRNKNRIKTDIIGFIKEILNKHKDISLQDIQSVGFIETGEFQYKINNTIKNRQVVTLLAFLCWFYDITSLDIYG